MRILKTQLFIAGLFIGAALLSACNKTNNDQPISALTVINAFSGSASVDFYLDNKRINTNPLDYKVNTGYFNIYPGQRSIKAVNGENSGQVLARRTADFPEGQYISLFIAPKLENSADSATFVVSVDSLAEPEAGKASIRFVNLTPGSRKLDVVVKSSSQAIFSDVAFKGVTKFISVNPASDYILQIREAGIGVAPKLELQPFNVQAGKIYTVYSNGLWEGTGASAFGASVTINYN